jgi:hypothetical protein
VTPTPLNHSVTHSRSGWSRISLMGRTPPLFTRIPYGCRPIRSA